MDCLRERCATWHSPSPWGHPAVSHMLQPSLDLPVLSSREVSPISSNKPGCYGKPWVCLSRSGPSPLLWNHLGAPSKYTFLGPEPGSLGLRLPSVRILMHPQVCDHCSLGLAESLFTLMVEGLTGWPRG